MSILKILGTSIILLVIGLALFKFFKTKTFKENNEKFEIEKLTLENLIDWFKKNKIENKNNLALFLKPENDLFQEFKIDFFSLSKSNYKNLYVQMIFDDENNSILKMRAIYCDKIDDIIEEQFGEKDIIIYK